MQLLAKTEGKHEVLLFWATEALYNDNNININVLKAKTTAKGFQKPLNTITQVRKTH